MAKCNLGKVNLESTHPAVFLTNMHAGWSQGFALPCADESAVFAICYSFVIIAVLLQCFASNFLPCPFPPLLEVCPRLSTVLSKYFHQSFFIVTVLVGGRRQCCFLLTGSPQQTSLLCLILARDPQPTFLGTSSQAHLLAMSLT